MHLDRLLGTEPAATALTAARVKGDPRAVEITSVVSDSAEAGPGALFCAISGARADGHGFAAAAIDAGARALLVEHLVATDVPQIVVPDTRAAIGPVAAAFHGRPSTRLAVVGVTGTNGKTTTVHLLRTVLERAGWPTGLIGTLTGVRTTPEAPELQARLAAMVAEGRRAVAMEVSSHAMAMHRVDGTRFAVGVFTNLSRDHLDFHASLEDYFQHKARMFDPAFADAAAVNLDDPRGRLLRDAATVPTTGFSLDDVEDLQLGVSSSQFRWRGRDVVLHLGGRFNVANALAAATAASLLGIDDAVIAEGLADAGPVAGRFEVVDAGQPFTVVVDYAHTPDGLEQLLDAARAVVPGGSTLLVFGCGGDRDRSKRPAMGRVAVTGADRVVLTSDNPRDEAPEVIIDAVREGMGDTAALVIEPDRRAAIVAALSEAGPGDVVVLAGKGHETTQVIGDREEPFDDRVVAREELARLGWPAP
ncbi:UDP-N-acetylmuramoyl-L-alanyl-D-glutamate--2,6-diaminopimelate ligase [soil metagenome]